MSKLISKRAAKAARDIAGGLIVDLFAGGGGASTGIEAAIGRSVDIAINHDEIAIAVHTANHPDAEHYRTNVWDVKPWVATRGRHVRLLWASPDCKHFSIAKGGKPKEHGIRSLAWVVRDWARDVRPDIICLENVREFLDWGPLYPSDYEVEKLRDRPIKERKGETFDQWRGALELLGYIVEWRILYASDFGAPTKRKRLFLVARCDGQPIVWPEPTHGPGLLPFHTAAECIDFSIPCPSIFERKKPLADNTLRRIAAGIKKFVLDNPQPFIVGVGGRAGQSGPTGMTNPVGTITAKNDRALCVPTLVQTGNGERQGQRPRYLDIHSPLGTVMATGQKHALVAAFLAKHYGDPSRKSGGGVVLGQSLEQPQPTITARDHSTLVAAHLTKFQENSIGQDLAAPMDTVMAGATRFAEVRAFLTSYFGSPADIGQDVNDPLRTITTRDRFGLVTVSGIDYQIVDIGMRMLQPHELLRAQFGRFAAGYDMSKAETQKDYVRLVGNSVCPEAAEAVVRANYFPAGLQRAA